MGKLLVFLLGLLSTAYLEISIWIGVRWDYWTNRLYLLHQENMRELREIWNERQRGR
jgi:hypothetical protein